MHSLEYMLVLLAKRIRTETGNTELADAATALASASHDYVPERDESGLAPMLKDWAKRYDVNDRAKR